MKIGIKIQYLNTLNPLDLNYHFSHVFKYFDF